MFQRFDFELMLCNAIGFMNPRDESLPIEKMMDGEHGFISSSFGERNRTKNVAGVAGEYGARNYPKILTEIE